MDPKTGNNQQGNKPRAAGQRLGYGLGREPRVRRRRPDGAPRPERHPRLPHVEADGRQPDRLWPVEPGPRAPAPPGQGRRQGSRRSGAHRRQPSCRYARQAAQSAGETVRDAAGQAAETARQAAQSASETVRDAAGQVQQRAADLYDRAAETAEETYEQASEWARGAYDQGARQFESVRRSLPDVRQYGGSVQRFVNENPVLVGVAGLAAGLLLGALLPRTRHEDQVFGRWADEVRDQGLRYARDMTQRGREYVDEALGERPLRLAGYGLAARPASGPSGRFQNH